MNKIQDMHIHVRYALEDPNEFDKIISYGNSLGITEFVFLEHGFRISENKNPILVDTKTSALLKENVNRLNLLHPSLVVWSGIEIDYSNNIEFRKKTLNYLKESNFDIVIGGIHGMKLNSDEYYKAIIDMIHNYPINIIAHMKLYENYREQKLIEEIMLCCKEKDIKIEINTSDRSIWNVEELNYMLDLINKHGVNFTVGSDAHIIEEIGLNYENLSDLFKTKKEKI